jgi:type 2 lantibiotic biosynthesis protein LanM
MSFFERLVVRAATIDELLSDDFETLPGQKGDTDKAARRLAAWCRSCASGDWVVFSRRLQKDQLSIDCVLTRLATVRRSATASMPLWLEDARWIDAACRNSLPKAPASPISSVAEPRAFEALFIPVVEQAEKRLWARTGDRARSNLTNTARADLCTALLGQLSDLCVPALYNLFITAIKTTDASDPQSGVNGSRYDRFVSKMKASGFRQLFEDRPVLLRLIASITRQWIDATSEFLTRLDADLPAIRREILRSVVDSHVTNIEGGLSDPHNGGRSVQIVTFDDGSRVVYKPKDLQLEATWHVLVERLNCANPPIDLKTARILPYPGYGWMEFINHTECRDWAGFQRFFRRAGAWLALFHVFCATDMHDENLISAGDQPVPIDLEMILQASLGSETTTDPKKRSFELATEKIANSVTMIGLLPAYDRSPNNNIFGLGGLDGEPKSNMKWRWHNINTDDMRPSQSTEVAKSSPNLPHINGKYATLGDHIDDLVAGFETYSTFLMRQRDDRTQTELFNGFAGLSVRQVIRSTNFYWMLLQRVRDHCAMDDGVLWSAQIDFIARLADWDADTDPLWRLQRAERAALVELNIPRFLSPSDETEISGGIGTSVHTAGTAGLDRARDRLKSLNQQEIAWQVEVIRQSTITVSNSARRAAVATDVRQPLCSHTLTAPTPEYFIAEAGRIAGVLSSLAIRSGPSAAWIGLGWLGDTEVCQLVPLGVDLYNGTCGIAIFLAAYARLTGQEAAATLALAALSDLRQNIRAPTAARMARSVGIGGALGLGSIVYALTLLSNLMNNHELLTDAHIAAQLVSDDLIAADQDLDIIGGSAGAILGLLCLYRATEASDVLERATKCGDHLLGRRRFGPEGRRTWRGQGVGPKALNGMSHGAAGFAYSLASLSKATGRDDFTTAAFESIAFENASYDAARGNWPDFRSGTEVSWPCQWCHGATGIGLARIAMAERGGPDATTLLADVQKALKGTEQAWPNITDTLCCGTLGSIEFLCEASSALGKMDLRDLASRRLMMIVESAASSGGYRWHVGSNKFNLGLFRGLAGVGYTLLRQVNASLPNVTIWE